MSPDATYNDINEWAISCKDGKCCSWCNSMVMNLRAKTPSTHWGRVTHICVGKQTIIGSDNGLSPGRRQTIIWTNDGLLLIRPLQTNFSEISIKILTFSFTKIRLEVSSPKWRPFCLGLNVLKAEGWINCSGLAKHWNCWKCDGVNFLKCVFYLIQHWLGWQAKSCPTQPTYINRNHRGQQRKATVVKMAPTRSLALRSFCLLALLCDCRSLSNLQQSTMMVWYTLNRKRRTRAISRFCTIIPEIFATRRRKVKSQDDGSLTDGHRTTTVAYATAMVASSSAG